jgi:fibronectin type 3 domain-containing protein
MRRRAFTLAALALLGMGLAACGKKGPPVAPERRLPAAASGLRASVDGDAVVLSWINPKSRVDGTRLRDLTTIRLHRRDEAEGMPPKSAMVSWGQVVGYDEIASIGLEAPGQAVVRGENVQWVDRKGLSFGRRYVYVVTALDSTGRSSTPSERLVVTYLAAPGAPRNPAAAPGEGQVRLRWDPPASLIDGNALRGDVRYEILRATGADAPLSPVTPEPVAATSFTDTGLENETTYRYAIRAVRSEGGGAARGEASTPVAVTPVDMTPPGPPANLVVIPSATAVRLSWRSSPDADVAVYAVYRATGTGGFMRIGTTAAITTVFIDRDVTQGTRYRYAVTALDRARTPNESARSNEVTVVVP